jgi:hypothetical protein
MLVWKYMGKRSLGKEEEIRFKMNLRKTGLEDRKERVKTQERFQ